MNSLIRQYLLLFLSISLIITFPNKYATASAPTASKTILILGDSLSAGYGITRGKGWVERLQTKFDQSGNNIRLINASISGDTTANGLNRLPGAIANYHPDVIIIELGGNDGLRGLPVALIKKNLQAIINTSLDSGAHVAIMEIKIPPNYGKKYTLAIQQLYSELASQYSVKLLPFILREIALQPELMQNDGIHPNEQAQPFIAEQMYQQINALLGE